MASFDYYVDNAAGADTNGGTSAGAAIVSGASADTDGTTTVALSDDTPDLSGVSVGDCIRLASEGGNGIRTGDIFEITAVDDGADTVTVTPTPGSNLNQAWAIGGAWATLQKSCNTIRAADTDKVWIKGGTDYTETMDITLAMGFSTPATIEGYTSSTGDGGMFTINGGAARASGLTDTISAAMYMIFKNMRITNHTGHGVSVTSDSSVCKNCQFDNNTGSGFVGDDFWKFEECKFDDNGTDGCNVDVSGTFIGCRAYGNASNGLECRYGLMYGCVAFSNGGNALQFSGSSNAHQMAINCTVDGDAKDTNTGIRFGPAFIGMIVSVNNIVYDCVLGMEGIGGLAAISISRNNLLFDNTDDYANFDTYTGEVTTAPQFTAEGSQDYTLANASPAKGAGFDGSQLEGDSSGTDMGARQRIESGGGGGLLGPNKRAGKQ